MNSIAGQYSTFSVYSLLQAGQNGSASGTSSANSSGSGQTGFASGQTANDLTNLGSALQSGSLSNAQNALANLQGGLTGGSSGATASAPTTSITADSDGDSDDSSETDPSGPFTDNTQANADYQSMVLNLGSGDLAAAAKDYTQLQTDLKLHSDHHHPASVTVDTNSSSDSTSGNVFSVTV